MTRLLWVLIMLGLVPANVRAEWSPGTCSATETDARARAADAVRRAKPNSLKYVPHPFPQSHHAIVEDFRYYVRERLAGTNDEAMAELIKRLGKDEFRFDIVKVAQWTAIKCSPNNGDFYHLLRVIEASSGREIVRAGILENGSLGVMAFHNERFSSIPDPAASLQLINSVAKTTVRHPVLVNTWGTLRCDILNPCMAARDEKSVYIATPEGEVYEISATARFLSGRKELREAKDRLDLLRQLGTNERLVSLGGHLHAIAQRLTK